MSKNCSLDCRPTGDRLSAGCPRAMRLRCPSATLSTTSSFSIGYSLLQKDARRASTWSCHAYVRQIYLIIYMLLKEAAVRAKAESRSRVYPNLCSTNILNNIYASKMKPRSVRKPRAALKFILTSRVQAGLQAVAKRTKRSGEQI